MQSFHDKSLNISARRKIFSAALIMFAIFACSSVPQIELPKSDIPDIDKIAHFLLYGLLSTLIYRIDCFYRKGLRGAAASVIIAVCYGISDEYHQSFTGRSCDIIDLCADAAGAVLAVLMYRSVPLYRNFLEFKISLHRAKK